MLVASSNDPNELCLELLEQNIEAVMRREISATPQDSGTYHSINAIQSRSTLHLTDNVAVKDLFNLIRATKNKDHGFFIAGNGRKYKIIVAQIEEETHDHKIEKTM